MNGQSISPKKLSVFLVLRNFHFCDSSNNRSWIFFKPFMVGLFCISILGCVPNTKTVYMQSLPDDGAGNVVIKSGELIPYTIEDYHLQYNDLVDITMKTTSAELNEILSVNESSSQLRNMAGVNSGDAFFLNGYTLNDEGIVELPLVGEVKLVGMSMKEAKLAIEEQLKKFIKEDNFFVRVRLGGIRYSALGEFNRPGKFTILQNRVTIFEAIANAGDMTQLAKRTEVLLLRQYPNGSKVHTLNLLSDKILKSEFFFIQPNDMIYARPMMIKQIGTGVTVAQTFQVAISVITVILLIYNVTK